MRIQKHLETLMKTPSVLARNTASDGERCLLNLGSQQHHHKSGNLVAFELNPPPLRCSFPRKESLLGDGSHVVIFNSPGAIGCIGSINKPTFKTVEMMELIDEVIELNPRTPMAYLFRTVAFIGRYQLTQAKADIEVLLSVQPEYPTGHRLTATLYQSIGEPVLAHQHFNKAYRSLKSRNWLPEAGYWQLQDANQQALLSESTLASSKDFSYD